MARLAYADTNKVNDSQEMQLLARGDHYFVHLVRGKPTPVRGGLRSFPFGGPFAVIVHTSRADGRMKQLFAEVPRMWEFVGGINRSGTTTCSIDDVKADKDRLYLLVRTSTHATRQDQIDTAIITVSLDLQVFWLEDGESLGEHRILNRSDRVKVTSRGPVGTGPDVPRATLELTNRGISCLSRTWHFDGKSTQEQAANKAIDGD